MPLGTLEPTRLAGATSACHGQSPTHNSCNLVAYLVDDAQFRSQSILLDMQGQPTTDITQATHDQHRRFLGHDAGCVLEGKEKRWSARLDPLSKMEDGWEGGGGGGGGRQRGSSSSSSSSTIEAREDDPEG